MEHHLEKRLPTLLNFVLICQDFASPATLRLYLENKGCMVVQQDDTIVGIGSTLPFAAREELRVNESAATASMARREAEIHAYLRTPINWKTDWPPAMHRPDARRQGFGALSARPAGERDDPLCLAFARAVSNGDSASAMNHHFFEEALSHVRSAYARHERKTAYVDPAMEPEELKPVKESIYLTAREHEILKWVSEGKGCWETGAILGISERTVKFHLQNIYRKLNVVNRAQAITKAMRYSLI